MILAIIGVISFGIFTFRPFPPKADQPLAEACFVRLTLSKQNKLRRASELIAKIEDLKFGPLAHPVEQVTLNHWVAGSSPAWPISFAFLKRNCYPEQSEGSCQYGTFILFGALTILSIRESQSMLRNALNGTTMEEAQSTHALIDL